MISWRAFGRVFRAALTVLSVGAAAARAANAPLSPTAIAVSADGATLFIAHATANAVVFANADGTVRQRVKLPAPPTGLALSPDGARLAVTCAAPQGTLCLIDVASARLIAQLPAGHTAIAPVFGRDGDTVFVSHRFQHEVAAFSLKERRVLARIAVEREPIAAALMPDGRRLFVANHLHNTTATAEHVAAAVSVIDAAARRVERTVALPNGSDLLLGVAVSPDGRYVAVAHNLARFQVPTTQLERGWMNTAALSLIDADRLELINTVLLDNVEQGAANPWAVGWTGDGARLLVTHAGTHEVSVIDFPGLLAKLARLPASLPPGKTPDYASATNTRADVPNDLAFLVGLRRRVQLQGNGPRALAIRGDRAWVPGYFSDTLELLDVAGDAPAAPRLVALGPKPVPSAIRRGEMYFNDATLCFQHWQSCATCHSYDARVDALNWDLLNDGLGSPKNVKSLLLAHRTPPAMSLGVRRNAEIAVRAGIRHILFAAPPPEVADALDSYLSSLAPAPSPWLENGRLSAAAQRGKKLFESAKVGCATCHPGKLLTDLQSYDVGTSGPLDRGESKFDTPTLAELWRTAPFLHDGSARTIREVLTTHNRADQHGTTSHLTSLQIDDLAAYVLSL